MYPDSIKNKNLQNDYSEPNISKDDCEVSKASAEIMLDRFCNGYEIEFPFSK